MEIGDNFTYKQMKECIESGGFIDYDGFGKIIMENGKEIVFQPSGFEEITNKIKIPNIKHIKWYNR